MGGNGGSPTGRDVQWSGRGAATLQGARHPALHQGGRSGTGGKRTIVSLAERGGNVRSFHVAVADRDHVAKVFSENVAREDTLHINESMLYIKVGAEFAAHEAVKHSGVEDVGGIVHTNTVEGMFSIFKRGMRGIYQHCREKHHHRYLAEFDFRYNHRAKLGYTGAQRPAAMIAGTVGKRLTINNLTAHDDSYLWARLLRRLNRARKGMP